MDNQVEYEIQNMNGEIVEKGYIAVEAFGDDEPVIYVKTPKSFSVPELANIDTYDFIWSVWDFRDGEKYKYADNGYTITINPDQE